MKKKKERKKEGEMPKKEKRKIVSLSIKKNPVYLVV
jgi:hypothetical protein